MKKRMASILLVVCFFSAAGGCVTRKLIIRSEPEGASTFLDGQEIGKTPVEIDFLHYGTRRVRVELEGRQTVNDRIHLKRPWYQYFPFDLVTELLLPFRFRDTKEYSFDLSKPASDKDAFLTRAKRQREERLLNNP